MERRSLMARGTIAGTGCERSATPDAALRVECHTDPEAILAARASIEELCQDLCESNVFFEPWFLFPALKHLGANRRFCFLCLYETGGLRRLCGFLPLVVTRLHPLVPLPIYQVWDHSQCFRCTPLIRSGHAEPFWQAILSWLEERPWYSRLLDVKRLPADGESGRALQSVLAARGSLRSLEYRYDTAVLQVRRSCDETLNAAMSGKTRRKRANERQQLERAGHLTFTDVDDGPNLARLTDEFLELEASGWKGEAGTALASSAGEAAFFRDVIRAAFERGRLSFLALRLDGRMIAAHCLFYDPPRSFHFKTAYDESFGKYSPGTQLLIEETRRMHDPGDRLRAEIAWSDSCVGPGSGPDYRCWPDRMTVGRWRITTAGAPHALPLAIWPALRPLKRRDDR